MINKDKLMHFQVGLMIAVAVGYFVDRRTAVVTVMILGLVKEWYDSRHTDKHTADGMDFIATMVGGLVGVVLV